MEYRPPIPETKKIHTPERPRGEFPVPAPELAAEAPKERRAAPEEDGALAHAVTTVKQALHLPQKIIAAIPQIKDELTHKVESIMEENLSDAYRALSPVKRQEFKIKGEETARQIRFLLQKTRVKIKKIFRLLLNWLLLLPGINRFYLEQEAKIKADKILALKRWGREEFD